MPGARRQKIPPLQRVDASVYLLPPKKQKPKRKALPGKKPSKTITQLAQGQRASRAKMARDMPTIIAAVLFCLCSGFKNAQGTTKIGARKALSTKKVSAVFRCSVDNCMHYTPRHALQVLT